MSESEVAWLILATYRSHLEIAQYPDSRVIKADCGHHAWLSPQGEGRLATSYTVCVNCAQDLINDPEVEKFAVTGSRDMVERRFGKEAAEAAVRAWRKLGIERER